MKYTQFYVSVCLCALITSITAQAPIHITKTTTIDLTEDVIISAKQSPFVALSTFGTTSEAKLIIRSKAGKNIIIQPDGTWDLTSFNTKNRIIEIAGNTKLICKPGAKIIGGGGVLRFTESASFIFE